MTTPKKIKPEVVKAWAWQSKHTGKLAHVSNGNSIHTAPTRAEAIRQGVWKENWRIVRVEIRVVRK